MTTFNDDDSGSIAVIFALALPVLLAAVSGAVEMTRATAYKQRLTSATELACNQAAIYVRTQRKTDLTKNYTPDIQTIITANLKEKAITDVVSKTPTISLTSVHVETWAPTACSSVASSSRMTAGGGHRST